MATSSTAAVPVLPPRLVEDGDVRAVLRLYGEPMALFGEQPPQRRHRLAKHAELFGATAPEAVRQFMARFTTSVNSGGQRVVTTVRVTEGLAPAKPAVVAARRALLAASVQSSARRVRALAAEYRVRGAQGGGGGASTADAVRTAAGWQHSMSVAPPGTDALGEVLHSTPTACAGAQGGVLFMGYADGKVWAFDGTSGDLHTPVPTAANQASLAAGGRARVTCVCPLPQGRLLVSRRSAVIELWAPSTANANSNGSSTSLHSSSTLVHAGSLSKHLSVVNRVAADPSGLLAVSTSDDMTACLWDVPTATALYMQDGHDTQSARNAVLGVDVHPDGAAFVTTDAAGLALLWDARTGRLVQRAATSHTGRCTVARFIGTGFHFATGGDDGLVHVYDSRALATSPLYSIAAHADTVTGIVCASPSGWASLVPSALVTSGLDGSVRAWVADDGTPAAELVRGAPPVRCLCVVPHPTATVGLGPASAAIAVGLRHRAWRLLRPVPVDVPGADVSRTAAVVVERVHGPQKAAAVPAGVPPSKARGGDDDNAHSDSDSDDDPMAALRKKARAEVPKAAPPATAPAPAPAAAAGNDSDSDDDPMAALRRK